MMARECAGGSFTLNEFECEDCKLERDLSNNDAAIEKITKQCSGCPARILKNGGCNKMHCVNCDTFFCWECLQSFPTEYEVYTHLNRHHGGIFDEEYNEEEYDDNDEDNNSDEDDALDIYNPFE